MPKVSVIMNCLNGERYVRDAIESVYAQEYQDWEIVFWDNASTDSTPEIAKSFDSRLRYFRAEQTVPLGEARALAFAQAQGEWVAILDHDDTMLSSRFRIQMGAIGDGDYVLSYGGFREKDEQGRVLREKQLRYRSGDVLNALLSNYEINITTLLMRRADLMQIHPEKVAQFIMSEEYYYTLMLAARGDACVVPDILAEYRVVASSWSEQVAVRQGPEMRQALAEVRQAYPGIEQRSPAGFALAQARTQYYDAKHLMQTGRRAQGRAILRQIGRTWRVYRLLYGISFLPPLWRLIHHRDFKARLTAWFSAAPDLPAKVLKALHIDTARR